MRAGLLRDWPALARFGLYPWNVAGLSRIELQQYLQSE